MISRVIYLNHKHHYNMEEILHIACRSYLQIFNFQAKSDNDDDNVSDKDYQVAQWVKHLKSICEHHGSLIKNDKRIMATILVLGFYFSSIQQDIKEEIKTCQSDGIDIQHTSEIAPILGPNCLFTEGACIYAMVNYCKMIRQKGDKEDNKLALTTIKSSQIPTKLKVALHTALIGGSK